MKISPDQNSRAEAMWRIISQRVDFRKKRVIDLGCGTGDFLWRPIIAGARLVRGYDLDTEKCQFIYEVLSDTSETIISVATQDINSWVVRDEGFSGQDTFDIAFCFSVLPYLDDVPATLKWMSKNFPLCLIECQYNGDGPGLSNIGADKGMMQLLLNSGFHSATAIGKTYVEGRKFSDGQDVYRTIWLCETKKNE